MLPVLEREIVEKKKWIDRKEIVDIFAVSQSVPGAIVVNSAIYLGYRLAGISGALTAMLGVVLPTFFIVIILATALASFQSNLYFQAALQGIKPAVVAFIAFAGYRTCKTSLIDSTCWILAAVTFILLIVFKNLNLYYIILIGAFAGILIVKVREKINNIEKTKSDLKKSNKDEDL